MSSPGQRRGTCGHVVASFDSHLVCACCRDKGKGKVTCVEKPDSDCPVCLAFSPEQRLQVSTPSYKIKKEKREAKKLESTPSIDSESLVDPSDVAILGAVYQQGSVESPPTVAPPEKKTKKEKASTSQTVKPIASSSKVDSQIAKLDQKWSDRFNRLEALLLARTIEPTFSANVKVTPTHSPPSSTAHSTEPFIRPAQPASASTTLPGTGSSASKHQPTSKAKSSRLTSSIELPGTGSSAAKHQPTSKAQSNQPTSTEHSGTDSSTTKQQSTSKLRSHQPHSDRPSLTDQPISSEPQYTGSPALHRSRRDSSLSSSSEAGNEMSDQPPLNLYVEEGELSDDQEATGADQDQPLSQEQTYRETMRGIRSFMGWSHIPDIDSATNTSEDNPFVRPKISVPGKVSVQMPTEDWLCKKLEKLRATHYSD